MLCGLSDYLLSEYFSRTRDSVANVSGGALYLGCQFAAPPPPWVVAQAAGRVDILCGDGATKWRGLPDNLPAAELAPLPWPSVSARPQ